MRKIFLTVATALALYGCATSTTTINPENPVSKLIFRDAAQFQTTPVDSIAPYITSGEYVQRANNLFVLFDASSSTTEDYAGQNGFKAANNAHGIATKLEVQREIVHRMNKTIANSATALQLSDFTTGLRSLGYGDCKGYGDRNTDLHQAPTIYSQDAFDKAIDTVACAHGRSQLAKVLVKEGNANPITNALGSDFDKSVNDDLVPLKGNIALVIISDLSKNGLAKLASDVLPDALNPNFSEEDKAAIKTLRARYNDRLCIYNVWMNSVNKNAEDPQSNESEDFSDLEMVYSKDNPATCGGPAAYTAERVSEVDGMKDFMRSVLLTPVPKPKDDCSMHDTDGDGVNDCDDRCPNTLPGTPVNKLGCWIVDVKFDNDKSIVKRQYYPLLDQLAKDISTSFPNLKLEVQGHTSSTASAAYNMRLSIRRANAVADYLNKRITSPHKLVPRGYGLTRPIDTNATEAGRANNRRVQLEVLP